MSVLFLWFYAEMFCKEQDKWATNFKLSGDILLRDLQRKSF